MDQADIPALLARLSSDEDATRKMAVFKLQTSINDPSFADVFISSGGLVLLRRLIMESTGNTLAYSLQSLTRLLEVDMGWDIFDGPTSGDLVERIVQLIVTNPLVNILRGAMSILVALVGHTQEPNGASSPSAPGSSGFRALKPAVAVHPQFFELVVQELSSADHSLCANALMLVNALLRDSLANSEGEEWSKMVKRLQDLGIVKAVYKLMQSSALQDFAHPVLEFQTLSKLILQRWRETVVNVDELEHRRALKTLHLSSAPPDRSKNPAQDKEEKTKKGHSPEKWRRLGFTSENPAQGFEESGCLGMMDFSDYVQKYEDGYQKLLLEQASRPAPDRCPIARASMTVTMLLYDHFDIDKADIENSRGFQDLDIDMYDVIFRPFILQWSRLHAAALQAFFRLWKGTGAKVDDFEKVAELVRILVEEVVGQASRTKDILELEDEIHDYDLARLREVQMELLEMAFKETWNEHLIQSREVLKQEALQFVKEQRIRCLLEGSWFSRPQTNGIGIKDSNPSALWRFAKLSPNRRYLHYADFTDKPTLDPGMNTLAERIDLATVSSVMSNVSASNEASSQKSDATVQNIGGFSKGSTKITIYGYVNPAEASRPGGDSAEFPILTLWPTSHSLASEWLDGLLMLLNQAPITAETRKLVQLVDYYGLKIRLLNVRMDTALQGPPDGAGVVPSRRGLDGNYFFEI